MSYVPSTTSAATADCAASKERSADEARNRVEILELRGKLQRGHCLIEGGAGTGKSTLICDFIRDIDSLWLESLDEVEADFGGVVLGEDGSVGVGQAGGGGASQSFRETYDVNRPEWGQLLVLTCDRRRADDLEDHLGAVILARWAPSGGRLVRSAHSYAFEVLQAWLREQGAEFQTAAKTTGKGKQNPEPNDVLQAGREQETGGNSEAVVKSGQSSALERGLESWQIRQDYDQVPDPEEAGRFVYFSGTEEDAWLRDQIAQLSENSEKWGEAFSQEALRSKYLRDDLKTLIRTAGELGVLPSDLELLGRKFNEPIWELVADLYAKYAGEDTAFTPQTTHLDSARTQRIAANVLEQWARRIKAGKNRMQIPLPRLVVVDDLQDFSLSTVALLQTMARLGTQILATSNAAVTVGAFRSGISNLTDLTASKFNWQVVELRESHRFGSQIAQVVDEVGRWSEKHPIPIAHVTERPEAEETATGEGGTGETGGEPSGEEREPSEPAAVEPAATELAARGGHEGNRQPALDPVEVLVGTSLSRTATLIADTLRKAHFLQRIPWEDMAVISRNSASVGSLRSHLERRGVPLAAPSRAISLAADPVCRQLLSLLTSTGGGEEEETDAGTASTSSARELNDQALSLLLSPLVGVDVLKLNQLLWAVRARTKQPDLNLAQLLDQVDELSSDLTADSGTFRAVRRAARIWKKRLETQTLEPQKALSELWNAAGVAEEWQKQALKTGEAARLADQRLDAVVKLFRRAGFWYERRLSLKVQDTRYTAKDFAAEILQQDVADDSVARVGLKELGVDVVTVNQAAGQEWKLAVVTDLQDGRWPSQISADVLTKVSTLQAIAQIASERGWPGAQPIEPYLEDGDSGYHLDANTRRRQKLVDEARQFASACSRAKCHLVLAGYENEDESLSAFLLNLAKAGLVPPLRDAAENPIYTQTQTTFDLPTLVGRLRYATTDEELTETQRNDAAIALAVLARLEVTAANPLTWTGAGGISSNSPILGQTPEGEDFRISPSSLKIADDCPLRWLYEQIGGRDRPSSLSTPELAANQVGTLIHTLAEQMPDGNPEALQDAFEQAWQENQLDTNTYWSQRQHEELREAVGILGRYLANRTEAAGVTRVEVEERCRLQLGKVVVSGRIDRIEHLVDGTVRLVDIKTGKHGVGDRDAQNSLQLWTYQLALLEQGYQVEKAGLLTLANATKSKVFREQQPLDETSASELREQLQKIFTDVTGETFTGRGTECRSCPFQISCPKTTNSVRWIE